MNVTMTQAKRLPLHDLHVKLGARFMEFAGWEVPLQYTTLMSEHHAVRQQAGIFDVSHMGKLVIRGEGSYDYLERVLSNSLRKAGPGQALYSLLLNDSGGVVDDVLVYEYARDRFSMVVNAATAEKDFRWLNAHRPANVELLDESSEKTLLAVQGPASEAVLGELFGLDSRHLQPFHFQTLSAGGVEWFVAATGYTGERGFEISGPREKTAGIYRDVLEKGTRWGLVPAGFGARDTLRLEAKYLLYGQDMDDGTTPLEASLEWVCDFSKNFIGREALLKQKKKGPARKLIGFEMLETGIARHGHEVISGGKKIGVVTSGTFSPTLGKSIGLAYVPVEFANAGQQFDILIREKPVKAMAVRTPFYKKSG